ncbi:hypothetical protein FQZ97_543530 [compost metagenome]
MQSDYVLRARYSRGEGIDIYRRSRGRKNRTWFAYFTKGPKNLCLDLEAFKH